MHTLNKVIWFEHQAGLFYVIQYYICKILDKFVEIILAPIGTWSVQLE